MMIRFKTQTPWLVVMGFFIIMAVTWGMGAGPLLAGNAMPFAQGRLFEVSKPGATPNYVFGTMHVADRDVLRLPPPIALAFKGSRMLLVESDHDPVETYKIVEAMFLPEGRSLQDMLKPALYEEIVTAAEAVGMKERDVNRLRPWAIWILLGDPADESVRRASGQPVLDDALRLYASKRGVPVMALDRAAEIAALFTVGLSEADQLQLLENALRDPMSYDERYNAMRQSYLAGDLEALLMSMRPDDKTATEAQRQFADRFNHGLLTERNRRWIPRMTRHFKRGGVFVAVGAAHLPGETGILNLLEKAGYQVKRVL